MPRAARNGSDGRLPAVRTILHVGSTRPAKVEGVRDAVALIATVDARFAGAELRPHDLTAVAPRMPMSEAEIVEGARRRAEALLEACGGPQDGVFCVGVEGGVHPLRGGEGELPVLMLQTWACVTDGTAWSVGAGPAAPLPQSVARAVLDGHELGDIVDAIAGTSVRGTRGAWGVLTRDLVGRRDAFRLAALAAFAPFYNPAVYHPAAR